MHNPPKGLSALLLPFLLAPGCNGQNAQDTRISPRFSLSNYEMFEVRQCPSIEACITNVNPTSRQFIRSGDTFAWTFGAGINRVICTPGKDATVRSQTLRSEDFVCDEGAPATAVRIVYRGATRVFTGGSSVCVNATFEVGGNSEAMPSVVVSAPRDGDRYNPPIAESDSLHVRDPIRW